MLLLISGNRIVNVRISNRRARHVKRGQAHDLDGWKHKEMCPGYKF